MMDGYCTYQIPVESCQRGGRHACIYWIKGATHLNRLHASICKPVCFVLFFFIFLLSAGWSKDYTKSGRPFYRNDRDNTKTWDKPTAEASTGRSFARSSTSSSGDNNYDRAKKTTPGVASESPLPAGAINLQIYFAHLRAFWGCTHVKPCRTL